MRMGGFCITCGGGGDLKGTGCHEDGGILYNLWWGGDSV